jgi:flagellar basal body rod protein FlgG
MVFATFPIAHSAMQVADRRLTVSANNTANWQTAGFRPQQVSARSRRDGGVEGIVHYRNGPNYRPNMALDTLITEHSAIHAFLQREQALLAYQSNLKTIQTADQMTRDLIDVIA